MKTAYFHCIGGVSGDMILASMVDLGIDVNKLVDTINTAGISGFDLKVRNVDRSGLVGKSLHVNIQKNETPLKFKALIDRIVGSNLPKDVIKKTQMILTEIGKVASEVHQIDLDDVILHELGSIDTLVDVIGCVVGLELLGITECFSSPLPIGGGMISTDHGIMVAPAPATMGLIKKNNIPIVAALPGSFEIGETLTPTATAILSTITKFDSPTMSIEDIGYGFGHKYSPKYPNILSLWIGELSESSFSQQTVLLETNIDDMTAESLGYVMDLLFKEGALDVWFTSIHMKKNRPGVILSTLIPRFLEKKIIKLILNETTTFGIRSKLIDRYLADREVVVFETSLGSVRVKIKKEEGVKLAVSPEYDDCRKISETCNIPIFQVYSTIMSEASDRLLDK